MTLDELRKDKNELEKKINILIDEFINKYDVKLNDINFDIITSATVQGKIITTVISKIKIEL